MAAAAAAAAAAASNPTPSSVMYYGHAPHPEHHTPANGELDKSEEQIYESIYDTRWRLMNQVGLKLMLIPYFFKQRFAPELLDPNRRSIIRICTVHSGKKVANSSGELGPEREVVLNGFKGPESDFGSSKIRKDP